MYMYMGEAEKNWLEMQCETHQMSQSTYVRDID